MSGIGGAGIALVTAGMHQLVFLADGYQPVINLNPGAVIFRIDLTFAVLLAATRAVYQAFGALGNGATSFLLTKYTVSIKASRTYFYHM